MTKPFGVAYFYATVWFIDYLITFRANERNVPKPILATSFGGLRISVKHSQCYRIHTLIVIPDRLVQFEEYLLSFTFMAHRPFFCPMRGATTVCYKLRGPHRDRLSTTERVIDHQAATARGIVSGVSGAGCA